MYGSEERARDYLSRSGIDYLIVDRDGPLPFPHPQLKKHSFTRVLLSITKGCVSKIEFR